MSPIIAEALIPLAGIFMTLVLVGIPVAGITARFALKPVLEALAKYREGKGHDETVALLERRLAMMEEHLNGLDRAVHSLQDETEFRRQLEAPAAAAAVQLPAGSKVVGS